MIQKSMKMERLFLTKKKTEFATTGVLVCAGPMIHSTWLIILLDQNLHEITT
jgi:hypothetical protein